MFVSVERILHPEWKNKILIVGADMPRSVVSSADYTARNFGVKAGMPIFKAKELLHEKDVIFCPVHYEKYLEYSKMLKQELIKYGKIEAFCGIDEFFLDANDYLEKNNIQPYEFAKNIKEIIKTKIGLDLSIGISNCKWLAKFASNMNKNNITEVYSQNIKNIWEYSVEKMLWIGKKTAEKLKKINVLTIGNLANCENVNELQNIFGKKWNIMQNRAQGKEENDFVDDKYKEIKSISKAQTFINDIYYNNKNVIDGIFRNLISDVFSRLNFQKIKCRTISITIRRNDFTTVTRSLSLRFPTNEYYLIYTSVISLFMRLQNFKKIRLLGITLSNFSNNN
ncbi:MAG: DNA polymerase IV [Mycoplasmataceae bacterium]|nr:DNA polymerase IV [Mycoplasmataceae bacterium]